MATNADSMFPTASGLIRAEYPVTTPRDSSRRTRDWTADTDSPAAAARWASVARPSATSSRASTRSISSSGSLMAALYPSRRRAMSRRSRRPKPGNCVRSSPRRCRALYGRRSAGLLHAGRGQRRGEPDVELTTGWLAGAGDRGTPRRDPGRQRRANSPTWQTCSRRSACIRSASTICATQPRPFRWCRRRSGRWSQMNWITTRSVCSRRCWRPPTPASSPPNCALGSSGSWRARQLFDPALIAEARRIASDGGADRERGARGSWPRAVATFALSRQPIDRGWYEELAGSRRWPPTSPV